MIRSHGQADAHTRGGGSKQAITEGCSGNLSCRCAEFGYACFLSEWPLGLWRVSTAKKTSLLFTGRNYHAEGARLGRIPPDLSMDQERPSILEFFTLIVVGRQQQIRTRETTNASNCTSVALEALLSSNKGAKMKQRATM